MIGKYPQVGGREARRGEWSFFEKCCRFLKLEFTELKKSMNTRLCWKNSPKREGERHGRGKGHFSKMMPIIEMRIYLWWEEKLSILNSFSLQCFFMIRKYPQEGGREAWEGEWLFFETMVLMLETRIYHQVIVL